MSDLTSGLLAQLGDDGLGQIAGALGLDSSQASKAIESAMPAMIGGMAKNTQSQAGAQSLANALDGHDNSVFGSLGSLLGGGGDGAAILGHVLGAKQGAVENEVANQSGLPVGQIAKLLPMLAPLVMGYLGSRKKEEGLGPAEVGAALQGERTKMEAGGGLGALSGILDSDGDGSIIDDVMDIASGKSKGGIGGMLGKMFGR